MGELYKLLTLTPGEMKSPLRVVNRSVTRFDLCFQEITFWRQAKNYEVAFRTI